MTLCAKSCVGWLRSTSSLPAAADVDIMFDTDTRRPVPARPAFRSDARRAACGAFLYLTTASSNMPCLRSSSPSRTARAIECRRLRRRLRIWVESAGARESSSSRPNCAAIMRAVSRMVSIARSRHCFSSNENESHSSCLTVAMNLSATVIARSSSPRSTRSSSSTSSDSSITRTRMLRMQHSSGELMSASRSETTNCSAATSTRPLATSCANTSTSTVPSISVPTISASSSVLGGTMMTPVAGSRPGAKTLTFEHAPGSSSPLTRQRVDSFIAISSSWSLTIGRR
mmetsp:Transcript_32952/g.77670  ORF Transcript_32952/g.77670 Transcript_32952/m.77670 type:complete len:286 (-) Transcript_32952:1090-1947(-)